MLSRQAFSNDTFISLIVPKYQELSVDMVWNMIKDFDDYNDYNGYFPYYKNGKHERWFYISILSRINSDTLKSRSMERVVEKDNMV